jgi:hypothetical protein
LDAIILDTIVEWIDLKLSAQLLREADMPNIVQTRLAEDQDAESVLQFDQLQKRSQRRSLFAPRELTCWVTSGATGFAQSTPEISAPNTSPSSRSITGVILSFPSV